MNDTDSGLTLRSARETAPARSLASTDGRAESRRWSLGRGLSDALLSIGALALLAAGALLAAPAGGAAAAGPASRPGSATPSQIKVFPGNPYYLLLKAQQGKQVGVGARVGGCVIGPRASCRGADLSGADLSEATLVGAKLGGARLDTATFCDTIMPDGTVGSPSSAPCP
jgi:hypothetical protein